MSNKEVIEKFHDIYKATNGEELYTYLKVFHTSFKSSKLKEEDFEYISDHFKSVSIEKSTKLTENITYISENDTVQYFLNSFIGNKKAKTSIDVFDFAVTQTLFVLESVKEPTPYKHITPDEVLEIFAYPHIKDMLPAFKSFNILRLNGGNNEIMSTHIPQNDTVLLYSPNTDDRSVIKHDFVYQLGNVLAYTMSMDYFGVPSTFADVFEKALGLKKGTLKKEDANTVFCDCFIMAMLQDSPMYDVEPLHEKMKPSAVEMISNYFYKTASYKLK